MKITKQARRDAKKLFRTCKVNGLLDEPRVRQVVTAVSTEKPRGYLAILTHFQRLVRLEVTRCTARVESATALTEALKAGIEANLIRKHGPGLRLEFVENPGLLGGLRVKMGSDVYDGSVRTRLAALEEKLAD